jgi:hypothetical protein
MKFLYQLKGAKRFNSDFATDRMIFHCSLTNNMIQGKILVNKHKIFACLIGQ